MNASGTAVVFGSGSEAVDRVPRPARLRRPTILPAVQAWTGALFGTVCLTVGLALVATTPVLQVVSLGYMLESSRRVANTGRLRAGFPGRALAGRLGVAALGVFLWLLPFQWAVSMWASVRVIDPGGVSQRNWCLLSLVLLFAGAWLSAAACYRGGRVRHFLWPRPLDLLRGQFSADRRRATWSRMCRLASGLKFSYLARLGLLGLACALYWLVLPVSLLVLGRDAPLLGLLGGLILTAVVTCIPLLMVHVARENRLGAVIEWSAVRSIRRRGPLAASLAVALTLVSAVPLYLLKIEKLPADALWLAAIVFVVVLFPSRLACGWAWSRAAQRNAPAWIGWRLLGLAGILPLAALYAAIVHYSQYVVWDGVWSLYGQHAFLLPVPFAGW